MQRTVQYWRIVNTDGSPIDGVFPAADVADILAQAERDHCDRYRYCRDGMVLIGHGIRVARSEPMLILDKVRRENLPSVGDLDGSRLSIGLSPGQGLLEPTFCMFGPHNVVAMLTSGNGPRANRLAEYLRAKLGVEIGLDPVLTQDLDKVLDEMRASAIEVSIPAERVTRDLVGGDWAAALEANRRLADNGGVIRIGMSVGHKGSQTHKNSVRQHIRQLIDSLRSSGAVDQFKSAKVTGTLRGSQRSIDLHADQFVEKVSVDADTITNPESSVAYAREILRRELDRSSAYLFSAVPATTNTISESFTPRFIDRPSDEQRAK